MPSKDELPSLRSGAASKAGAISAGRWPHGARDRTLREPIRHAITEWTISILLYLFACTTLVQAFVIPTGSMEESLLIGDHLLVDKLTYAPPGAISRYLLPYQEVERGDIVVFRYPIDLNQTFVKRVVGVPGDRLRLVDKQLWINGRPAREPYAIFKSDYIDNYRDNFPAAPTSTQVYEPAVRMLREHVVDGELVVPEGRYFAMGDNRDQSLDSRYWGFVSRDHIIGKPLIVWWSYDAPTERLLAPGISLEHFGDLASNFFAKTRWTRTFKLVRAHDLEVR